MRKSSRSTRLRSTSTTSTPSARTSASSRRRSPGRLREQFAVKALPNPRILQVLHEEGAGTDNSSLAELVLSEVSGYKGSEILLTSNDTPADEFQKAIELGAIINLDDISHLDYLEKNAGLPEIICFRYNPTSSRAMTSSASRRKRNTA